MARSRTRPSSRTAGRQTSSRKTAPAAEAASAEADGMGLDAGIAIVTTILLVVAILFLDRELSTYGEGFLFK